MSLSSAIEYEEYNWVVFSSIVWATATSVIVDRASQATDTPTAGP